MNKLKEDRMDFILLVQRVDYKNRRFWATSNSDPVGNKFGLQIHDFSHVDLNPWRGQLYRYNGHGPFWSDDNVASNKPVFEADYNSAFQAGEYESIHGAPEEVLLEDFIVYNQYYYGIGQKKINKLCKVLKGKSVDLKQLISTTDDDNDQVWKDAGITKRSQKAFKLGYQMNEWEDACLAIGISYQATQRFFSVYQWESVEAYHLNPFRILAYEDTADCCSLWKKLRQNYSDKNAAGEWSAVWVVFYEASSGYQTALGESDLLQRLNELLESRVHAKTVFESVLKAGHLVRRKHSNSQYYQLAPIHAFERAIAGQLTALNQPTSKTVSDIQSIDWEAVFEAVGRREDFTKEDNIKQLKSFEQGQMLLIYGEAGTGKTYLSAQILKACDASGYAIEVIAVSNIAVSRVRAELERLAKDDSINKVPRYSSVTRFLNRKTDDLNESLVLLIDEASMVGAGQALRIFGKIRPQDRLIMVGDPRQVPPIGWGALFHSLENLQKPALNRTHLTDNKRQRDGGRDILDMVAALEGMDSPDLRKAAAKKEAIKLFPSQDDPIKALDAYLRKVKRKSLKTLPPILCFCRDDVAKVNWHLRMHRVRRDARAGKVLIKGFAQFREGEPVINTLNLEEEGLWNGSRGRIVKENGNLIARFELPDGSMRDQLINSGLERAYAVTVHRAQGEGHGEVIIYLGNNVPERLLHRGALYTAITRAGKKLIFIGSVDEFNKGYARANRARESKFLELHFA